MRRLLSLLLPLLPAALSAQHVDGRAVPRRPNVLVAIADDWSYGHATVLGTPWCETPAFDRVAREGAWFTRAYTPNAKCAPSRACLLTGRNSWQLDEAANHWPFFPPEHGGFFEVLAAHGYRAGFTGKGYGPGVVRTKQGEPRSLTGVAFQRLQAEPPAKGIGRLDYAGNFGAFLDTVPEGEPWVFWYGSYEPHRGYEAGSGQRAGKDPAAIARVPTYWPDTEAVRSDMLDYALEVEHFDRHLGRMLQQLEARGELDRTLVIVTSDHGMPFPRVKGQAYEASNHVPFAVRFPAVVAKPGRAIDAMVSLVDVAPTVLAACGIDDPAPHMQAITGVSLLPLLGGEVAAVRDAVLIGKERHDVGRPEDAGYPIRGLCDGTFLFLHNHAADRWPVGNPETGYLNCDGSPTKSLILMQRRALGEDAVTRHWQLCFGMRPTFELYHVGADPDCTVDLAAHPAYQEVKERMQAELEARLRAEGDPRMVGDGARFDRYEYSDARSRDFYRRFTSGEPIRAGWVSPSDFEAGPVPKVVR